MFLLILRILTGLGLGCTYGSFFQLVSVWTPLEKSSMSAMTIYTGTAFGVFLAHLGGGYMVEYIGWEAPFYVFGAKGIIWFIFAIIFMADTPEDSKFITNDEVEYLTKKTAHANRTFNQDIPWRDIFLSLPVWAFITVLTASTWTRNDFYSDFPRYMHNVLGFTIQELGVASACLTSLLFAIPKEFSGLLFDSIAYKYIDSINLTNARKVTTFIGGAGQCLCYFLMTVPLVYQSHVALLLLISFAIIFQAIFAVGFTVNAIELAPQFSNILLAIAKCIGNVVSSFAPITTGAIVTNYTVQQWNVVL